jgi:hypothetical protein
MQWEWHPHSSAATYPSYAESIWTAIKTCRTLSAERGTRQSMGTTTFLIR